MTATPMPPPLMPALVQVVRVHVDRERIAFAKGGGIGDFDVVDVDVVLAERAAHVADEAYRGIAAAVIGDVVRLVDEAACRWPAPFRRPTSVQVAPPLPLACTET